MQQLELQANENQRTSKNKALTFTSVTAQRGSNRFIVHSASWVDTFFCLLSQDLKHFPMSVKLDLDVDQCHETERKRENYRRKHKGVVDRTLLRFHFNNAVEK